MTHQEALDFLRPAMETWRGEWMDAGAGTGTFTAVIAELLAPGGTVYALDESRRALAALRRLAKRRKRTGASRTAHAPTVSIVPVAGDMLRLDRVPELQGLRLAGVLFANALHYTARPEAVLRQAARLLEPDGRVVVIEYDRRTPNPWVPHPLPPDRLAEAARLTGFSAPRVVARRPSVYHREMYLATLLPAS